MVSTRTSVTKTSDRARPGIPRGFTLLELLVVLTIVAILTGTVVLGFTGADQEQALKGAAMRMAGRFELARQHALTRNREWGVYVEDDGIRFAEFDPDRRTWVEQEGRPFDRRDLPERVRLRLTTEGVGELPYADEESLPEVIVFSSGEVTPFTIILEPEWRTAAWLVRTDGLAPVRALREGATEEDA